MPDVEEILSLLARRGDSQYGGEAVTQLEHALQAASLAEAEGVSEELVTAALLHDLGHMLHDLPDDAPDAGVDDRHEEIAARQLEGIFPDLVTGPIRLHVDAKRYLCHAEPAYLSGLSEPSRFSLALQGGPMTPEEAAAFLRAPHASNALRLRRWDDAAKVPGLATPPLQHFAAHVRRVAFRGGRS